MVKGHPDFGTWTGRSGGGETVTTYSTTGSIPSDSSGYEDLPVVATGYKNVYMCLTASCDDDTGIHRVTLTRVSDDWTFFHVYFINGGIFDFPGQEIGEGETVRLTFYNNCAATKTFKGTVSYITKKS